MNSEVGIVYVPPRVRILTSGGVPAKISELEFGIQMGRSIISVLLKTG